MFVQKDLRKIAEILDDDSDPKERLFLARRAAEHVRPPYANIFFQIAKA